MIRRILARRRLELVYHRSWYAHPIGKRPIGPRPMLGLHRLPDPHCTDCGGLGEVAHGSANGEEPDYDDCHCAPFLPLAHLWLPKAPCWARRRPRGTWHDPWCSDLSCTHCDSPPF
ncbi:hypothetical protein [Streptomyces bambusae]|uniref:Uncharacterized protein n=1 Tax=Streptomyces bambusae TaxID=1550616 RepID=A0ABS6ZD86_9ACTN|nr:hypothetical protein [Streptomyces bambusae]MBW5485727.1 hypothetical protein [Streptomyces bambusae]